MNCGAGFSSRKIQKLSFFSLNTFLNSSTFSIDTIFFIANSSSVVALNENFSPFFQGITPRSLLPVLVDDGEVHIESNDILEYLDNKFPANRLIPSDKKEEIKHLVEVKIR